MSQEQQTAAPPLHGNANAAVIIPHLNRLDDTRRCCESLARQTLPPRRIWIVDNASTAHTQAELAAACPQADILRLSVNRGFAGGVNAGIREALAQPSISYLWVLNNDTVAAPDTLEQLVAAAEADALIGLVGAPLLEGSEDTGRRRVPPGKHLWKPWAIPVFPRTGQPPDYLSGACLLIRRRLLEDIGSFDDGFFFFFEDADFSRRAVSKGWRLAVAEGAQIEHLGSATIRRMGELQARSYRAGHVRYLRKHANHPLGSALPPFIARLALDALRLNRAAVRGNWQGWRTAWRQPVT
ncbi:MAG: glycosyltransferase family 2 protein [Lentisphaerae bacterium]|nr:glycosyltransferase family 2 protein [Lentisphaerota bacterium]